MSFVNELLLLVAERSASGGGSIICCRSMTKNCQPQLSGVYQSYQCCCTDRYRPEDDELAQPSSLLFAKTDYNNRNIIIVINICCPSFKNYNGSGTSNVFFQTKKQANCSLYFLLLVLAEFSSSRCL